MEQIWETVKKEDADREALLEKVLLQTAKEVSELKRGIQALAGKLSVQQEKSQTHIDR